MTKIEKRKAKKDWLEHKWEEGFIKQLSTNKIDIINLLIKKRTSALEAQKTYAPQAPVFSKYCSLFGRKNAVGLGSFYN
jgi:hypothetical protein